jgi:hypothetical protein
MSTDVANPDARRIPSERPCWLAARSEDTED